MVRALALTLTIAMIGDSHAEQFLWQTNSEGDDVHVIRVSDWEVIGRIEVGPQPHGIAAPMDARVVFVSLEANGEEHGALLWIDPRRHVVEHRIPVGREPHAIAATPDGRWVYVACRDGTYWIVDADARSVVTKVRTGGRPHNVQASADGRFMYLSPMGSPPAAVTVVDVVADHKVVGVIPYSDSVRPSALSPDGILLFQHVDGLNGFEVAETESRRMFARIEHSSELGWRLPIRRVGFMSLKGLSRCHGLAVRPDQEEVWSTCGENLAIHGASQPAFEEVAIVRLSGKGYWLTFSPDSRYGFVALSERNAVAVVDSATRDVIRRIAVGNAPKRNVVLSY